MITTGKEKPEQGRIIANTSKTASDPNTPYSGSSTASLQPGTSSTVPMPGKESSEQLWTSENDSKTASNLHTPHSGSNPALLQHGPTSSAATSGKEKPEQGWVTAALGQEGMDITMQEGQVDGDPAIEWHAEGTETAWNAVKLEAGHKEVDEPAKGKKIPAAEQVRNVVVWFGPQDPAVSPVTLFYKKRG